MTAMSFPILSFEQANPMLAGMNYGQGLINQSLQNQLALLRNQYAPQMMQQDLLKSQLANQLSQGTLQPNISLAQQKAQLYTPQMQAAMALQNAQAKNALANAGLTNNQSDLLRQQTPYLVRDAESKVYSDPILSRLFQITQAQKTGAIPAETLAATGLAPSAAPSDGAAPAQIGNAAPGMGGNYSPASAPKLFGGDAAQNWALFGSPVNPIQMAQMMKAAQTEGSSGVTTYNDALKAASDTAQDASDMNNYINQFRNAYDKSTYKGPAKGELPSSGALSALVPGDLTPEQQADSAAQNMQELILKLMHTNRLTNYELQFARNLKLNRSMTPDTVKQVGDFLSAKVGRLKEQQDFLNAARSKGVDAQTASSLWQLYNDEKPVYNWEANKATGFKKDWADYLKPEMVMAIKQGGLGQGMAPSLQNQYGSLTSPKAADPLGIR